MFNPKLLKGWPSCFTQSGRELPLVAELSSITPQTGNDMMPEAACSLTSGPRLQTPKGSLMKWRSFNTVNSKPKVKLVDEVVVQTRKGAREHASLDSKEEPARIMRKSMSFGSNNSGRRPI
ncbi:hypothetical protein HRI_000475300 [Hibiscus trionum]|uniref:Uncharacterized protein n=1 Tax=Hibiscus trionum TaxID=183268 RepID=A0A9W7LLX5_HIBTR|nr:hypothetical protein HRI_000475300 [Hibiscus trionum]